MHPSSRRTSAAAAAAGPLLQPFSERPAAGRSWNLRLGSGMVVAMVWLAHSLISLWPPTAGVDAYSGSLLELAGSGPTSSSDSGKPPGTDAACGYFDECTPSLPPRRQ